MTKNGQYSFMNDKDLDSVWRKGWRWGFAWGVIAMFLAAVGIILELADSLKY